MKKRMHKVWMMRILLVFWLITALCSAGAAREMAITIDDLPVVGGGPASRQFAVTRGILGHLNRHRATSVGFVNESKLGSVGSQLLELWLKNGQELGNHTYSHASFFKTPYQQFLREVTLGERVTRALATKWGSPYRYFRHPYLNTGPDLKTKKRFEEQLSQWGYIVAPVTIDNSDWMFARAYDRANGNISLRRRIAKAYLDYMLECVAYFEKYTLEINGKEAPQILLLHANALNAHHLGKLLERLETNGYKFVSLEEALQDPIYDKQDAYTGYRGISWLQRWEITNGGSFRPEPKVPEWIEEI